MCRLAERAAGAALAGTRAGRRSRAMHNLWHLGVGSGVGIGGGAPRLVLAGVAIVCGHDPVFPT